jgi:hypothetical protein
MKQTAILRTQDLSAHGPWLQSHLHWLGVLSLCAALIALSACDSGSSGDGIDPGIIEVPLAFIKRPIPVDDMGNEVQDDLREPRLFSAGGDVYLRSNSTVDGEVTNLTRSITGGTGDVKGLNASYDGSKLIFSLRLFDPAPNNDNIPPPSWNIYEYDIGTGILRSVIPSVLIAELGDDLYPAYLPDDRIVFTSSRQDQARGNLVNEGKQIFSALDEDRDRIATVLHVMNPDGSGIRQVSLNKSNDLQSQVLVNTDGGQLVFSRWDNAGGNEGMHLYKSNPDGSNLEMIYGAHSHDTGTGGSAVPLHFSSVREMPNGDLMVIARPFTDTFGGGDIFVIEVGRFVDNDKPIWPLKGLRGPAQKSATVNTIPTDGTISTNGRYSSAFPLQDDSSRILVSKSTCQVSVNNQNRPCVDPYLSDPRAVEASPAYGIWLYNMDDDTEKPIILAEQGQVITEAIAIQTSLRPPVVFDKGPGLDSGWISDNVGVINIKSVYDMGDTSFDGCFFGQCETSATFSATSAPFNSVSDFADPLNATADERPVRFVRFLTPVGIPDPDELTFIAPDLLNQAFGRQLDLGMREIVGYAPVEPDGSVKVKVPANVPLGVEVLDAEGRRIGPRHLNWFQVLPGDTATCTGCHEHPVSPTPEVHGRSDGTAPSINSGIQSSFYPRTLIPGNTSPFPYFSFNLGETMAEVRFGRVSSVVPLPAPEPVLNADLNFVDYWTDPAITPPVPALAYSYSYDDLDPSILSPAPPAKPLRNSNCNNRLPQPWRHNCRITINYPRHIQAIWELDRGADTFTPLAPANPVGADPTVTPLLVDNMATDGIGDDTCTSCHTSVVAAADRLPYGQLDLTLDPNQVADDFFRSFRELLFNDQGQEIDAGGNLVDINPAVGVPASMTANGARSSFFIEKMTGTELDAPRVILAGYDHTPMLSGAELKLISEWLDLGAQNFNDPFDLTAPQN